MEDLEQLQAWLRERKIRRVVLESTGVYWIPVWNVLERSSWKFEMVLVNPRHVKAIPGQKTDQKDSERLAEFGQYNLLRGSFVPSPEFRELRELTRRRTQLQGERNRILNRIERLLEIPFQFGQNVQHQAGLGSKRPLWQDRVADLEIAGWRIERTRGDGPIGAGQSEGRNRRMRAIAEGLCQRPFPLDAEAVVG